MRILGTITISIRNSESVSVIASRGTRISMIIRYVKYKEFIPHGHGQILLSAL